jgi:predicted exporter
MTELQNKVKQTANKIATSHTACVAKEARWWLVTIWAMVLVTIITIAITKPGVIEKVAVPLVTALGVIFSAVAMAIKSKFIDKK